MNEKIMIVNQCVGNRQPCFIIAEAGVNHNRDFSLAKLLIDEASKAGADAVKFQTFKTEKLVTHTAEKSDYQKKVTGSDTQSDMLKNLELTENQFRKLSQYAKKGYHFFYQQHLILKDWIFYFASNYLSLGYHSEK